MQRREGYLEVARARREQVGVRVGIAGFIGLAAYFLAPSHWPAVWFGAVVATQVIENLFSRWLTAEPGRLDDPLIWATMLAAVAFNSAVYVGLSAYLWFCGPAGQMFAIMVLCGGLLHVCLHYQRQRDILIAAMIAQWSFLVGLPVVSNLGQPRATWTPLIVMLISAVLYLAHLVLGVVKNARTNRALEAASAEAERLKDLAQVANQSKSDFLATISHEIRTPLNAVTTASHLLSQTATSDAQREYIAILGTGSDVLLSLINQVLDMSKIEAGKMTVEVAATDLVDLSERLLRLWRPKALDAGLSMTLQIDPDLPPLIQTDPLRLNQILFNLTSNAVKFTSQGSVDIRIHRADAWIVFEVSDTGAGLTPEVMSRLFNSFEQADARITRTHGGTGLGLAISRQLAGLMGGDLTVASEQGRGSTFRLRLPLIVGQEIEPVACEPHDAISPSDLRPASILLAEDHPVNRRLVALLLEPHGYDLTMVENGAEALAIASTQAFDVILMDMQMPVMDGLEATRAILTSPGPNRHTPVIALTANAFDFQRQAWIEAGAFDFLTKPIDPTALIGAIQSAMDTQESDRLNAVA